MKRRGFLQMLGLAPLAAVVAGKVAAEPVKAAKGQVLEVVAGGPPATWAAPPTQIPAPAESGQVLVTGNEGHLEWKTLEPGRLARFDPEVGKRLQSSATVDLPDGVDFQEYNETYDHTLQPVNVSGDRFTGGHLSWSADDPNVFYVTEGCGVIGLGGVKSPTAVAWPAREHRLAHGEMFTHVSVDRDGTVIVREGIFPSAAQRRAELHLGFLTLGKHVNNVYTGSFEPA